MLEHDHKPGGEEPTGADGALGREQESKGILVTRRTALVAGGVGVGGLMLGGGLAVGVPAADAALPTTTGPEQLRLEFGNDPETEMTVSWSAPGTVPMPAPTLAYSTRPISATNQGTVIPLPESAPLDLTNGPRRGPSSTSFLDGQTGQTTYHYHVPLKGLRPDTTYFYEVSDGAGSTASAQFRTAPRGRASFRFTAFGDQGVNPPSPGTTAGVLKPGDGAGAPLFHLMVGDLAYANTTNPPSVWRPWALMIAPAASTFPWMPVPGNHELETGTTDITGRSTGVYNGPYGLGTYMARYLLPENGLTNWDGNTLQGNFYSFQVGTVLFVNLYGNDVIWQTSDFSSPNVTQYTGDLKAEPGTTNLVPDDSAGTPNLQLEWLERTLSEARRPSSGVEMIVVQFHFPFASVDTGNSCDMGLRAAFGPLFDKYEVDITLSGHNHNYCRSLPVRGYDPPAGIATGEITNPFGTFATGDTLDTRRPTVRQSEPISIAGQQVFDTSLGTVHLVVGGGGAGSTIGETIDSETGFTQAHPFASSNGNNVQALEDAPWLGFYDTVNAYGYGVFDVDPGDRPGETSITFQWFSVPPTGSPLPTTPVEKFTFTRRTQKIQAGEPIILGRPTVGHTVTADPGNWSPRSARFSYQWLRAGLPIAGATSWRYTLTAADLDQQLQVQVTGTIPGNITDTATSASVVGGAAPPRPHHVTMSGKLAAGGSVAAAAVAPVALGATRKFQWLRDGEPISGATDSTYDPLDSDAGSLLEVQVTETVDGYDPVSVTSAPQPVSGGGTALAVPTLTPEPIVGVAVQAKIAAEEAAHQWLLDGAEINGAESASYTPVPADAGKQLQLKLSADGESVISAPQTVAAAPFKAASRPGFRGTPAVGGTLSAIAGPWSPNPTLSYQWLQDGEPIDGATEDTLVVPAACAGKEVSLQVTAERTGYITREMISDAVTIGYGTIKSSMPRIEGDPRVDQTLHVIKGEWSAQAEFHYQWIVGGIARDGRSTGPAYKVRPEDRGQHITVEVTGQLDGCEPVVRSSAATEPVRRG
jgi:Purple acid Phosphatase, N-terminal domain/Calcineurin-like phosphoesterase